MKHIEEFSVGLRSAPYLADHGFQDMVVLPGSFYIEKALSLEKRAPHVIRNVTFQNPIILSSQETVIKVQAHESDYSRVKYAFYEAGNEQCAAALEIDREASASLTENQFSIETFQARAQTVINSESFYKRLRENGNQYGRRFQKVSEIWRAGDEVLGKISVTTEDNASFLDSITQLLAPFILENGRTFVLGSIEKINVIERNFPRTLWGYATVLSRDRNHELFGNVRVFDDSGKAYLEMSGVALTLLDRVDNHAGTKVVVAANFTAEPLEDSLKFWDHQLNVPLEVEFAPYNQIFQQLLDPASPFRKNHDGINIILLSLEEWARAGAPLSLTLTRERAEECFEKHQRCVLPNGVEIAHLNPYETEYVYDEIFEDQCYLRHGIRLQDSDTVVDIGANIGLFSLFVMSRCKQPKIYAFEPASRVYDLLKANCEAYGPNARVFNMGVADKPGTATFTFYEKSSVFSGFHSDENDDRAAIQTVVRNVLNGEGNDYVQELTADRLRHTTHECRLTSVSEIIRQNGIDKINLLKIDAEKSELAILRGIDDSDWSKIDQIVMEIHDRTGHNVRRIEELLQKKGYDCAIEEEALLADSGLFNLYATREKAHDENASHLNRNVQDFCTALRSFMHHRNAPLILCCTPCKAGLNAVEETLLLEASKIPNVHVISSASVLRGYPVENCYDRHTNQTGHIPYTPEAYAAIGTTLVRMIFNLKTSPFKVIALDCDNTLWKGVCGEDGPAGIELTPAYLALQQFMVDQTKAGMLLCLCSKNNETDALEVFDRRTDMLLKRKHLVAWRLNWTSKSENLKSLAKELNLGLDSFILLDDNPVECAEVKINCPGVLTLQLPSSLESFAHFLNHIWAFDLAGATKEDENRTRMYQQNAERQRFREQTLSLKDFLHELELRVDITEATEQDLSRVAQLTYRTNQFNFTTIRRSENEIRQFLQRASAHCLVVRVSDRFGDYGLVGVVMYASDAERYTMDTFLLSCRVLGRGVEHAVLSSLGARALSEGKQFLELNCVPTEKNLPALEFLKSIGGQSASSSTFLATQLASLQYEPKESTESPPSAVLRRTGPPTENKEGGSTRSFDYRAECLQRIAENFSEIGQITKAIEEYRLQKEALPPAEAINSGNKLESALLNIWRKVLARPRIGLSDNFFDAGGTSLRAVQVIAAIKKELKEHLSIVTLFECPTVSLLAAKLKMKASAPQAETRTSHAAERGQRRRYNLGGRASPRAIA